MLQRLVNTVATPVETAYLAYRLSQIMGLTAQPAPSTVHAIIAEVLEIMEVENLEDGR